MASVFSNKYCELCKVMATSELVWKDHIGSKKHQKKLKALESANGSSAQVSEVPVTKVDKSTDTKDDIPTPKTEETLVTTQQSNSKVDSTSKVSTKPVKETKSLVDILNAETSKQLTPRLYQLEILEEAVQSNSLAFLGTGSGKTLIAVLFIKFRLALAKKLFELSLSHNNEKVLTLQLQSKKIIAFIAPTKILVEQQCRYIKSNCDCNIRSYTGEANISGWTCDDWINEIGNVDCLVFTPEVFRQLIQLNLLPVKYLDSVIFDECHHAYGRDPM